MVIYNSLQWDLVEYISRRIGHSIMGARIGSVLARNGAVASHSLRMAAGIFMPPEVLPLVMCGSWFSRP